MNAQTSWTVRFASVLLLTSAAAHAQVHVDYLEGSEWVPIGQYPAGSDLAVTDVGSRTYRIYTSTPTSQSIGAVTLRSLPSAPPSLIIGVGLSTPDAAHSPAATAALNLRSVSCEGGKTRLQISVGGDILGSVVAWNVVRIDAGGRILGDVIHDPADEPAPPPMGPINATDVGSASVTTVIGSKHGDMLGVYASNALFANIECSEGSITGPIRAGAIQGWNGQIACKSIRAPRGSINAVTSTRYFGQGAPVFNLPVLLMARDGISLVRSFEAMHADITANAGGRGDIGSVEVLDSGQPFANPSFYGSITAENALGDHADAAIYAEQDFVGTVTLAGSLHRGVYIGSGLGPTTSFTIGGSIASDVVINIGSQLAGSPAFGAQFIVNAADEGGSWAPGSTVEICGARLAGPRYTQTVQSLGGGSVGEAPFDMHAESCSPPNGGATTFDRFAGSVVIRHYGPVITMGSSPLLISARPIGGSAWVNCSSDFSASVPASHNHRDLLVQQKGGAAIGFRQDYEYRITPIVDLRNPNALRCLDVKDKPAVRNYIYSFRLLPPADH